MESEMGCVMRRGLSGLKTRQKTMAKIWDNCVIYTKEGVKICVMM